MAAFSSDFEDPRFGEASPPQRWESTSWFARVKEEGHAVAVRQLLGYANDLKLAHEQQLASLTKVKVRHVASAVAPLVLRELQLRRLSLMLRFFDVWRSFAIAACRAEASRVLAKAANSQRKQRDAHERQAAMRAGSIMARAWLSSAPQELLANCMKRWHLHATTMQQTRHATHGAVSHLSGHDSWFEGTLVHMLSAWRTCAADGHAHRISEATRVRRRPLLVELSEVGNELADVKCRLQLAESSRVALQAHTSQAMNAIHVAWSAGSSHAVAGCAGSAVGSGAAGGGVGDEAAALSRVEAAHRVRGLAKAALAEAFETLGAGLPQRGAWSPRRAGDVQDLGRQSPPELIQNLHRLRGERLRLVAELQALHRNAAQKGEETRRDMSQELERERAKTEDLQRRLGAARDWVAGLRERHWFLVNAEADRDGNAAAPSVGGGARRPPQEGLPRLQEALGLLAKVSEELLEVRGVG